MGGGLEVVLCEGATGFTEPSRRRAPVTLGRAPVILGHAPISAGRAPVSQGLPRSFRGVPWLLRGTPRLVRGVPRSVRGVPQLLWGVPRNAAHLTAVSGLQTAVVGQPAVHRLKPRPPRRAVLKGKRKGFATPTETNLPGDALCFVVRTWARHKTTETVLNSCWWLAAVGGWRLSLRVLKSSKGQPCPPPPPTHPCSPRTRTGTAPCRRPCPPSNRTGT